MTFDSNNISLADFIEIEVTTSTKATNTKIEPEYRNFMATPEEIANYDYGKPHKEDETKNVVNMGEVQRYPPLGKT